MVESWRSGRLPVERAISSTITLDDVSAGTDSLAAGLAVRQIIDLEPRELRADDFPVLMPMTTRWSDNDVFGHLNNAVYYELFDSAINRWAGQAAGLDPAALPAMGVDAASGCCYLGR